MSDAAHMRAALALARRGLGLTAPNPSVGCVIVRDGRVVGRATTAAGGRPHAETQALAMAGAAARGASAYVTLEPCCHHARTPPCADALVAAGIARVLVAARDPDPRVDGAGIARLRAAGIAVEEGLLGAEAAELNEGFFSVIARGRPMLTLKLASTLDGRIATHAGEARWITGEAARRAAHLLRYRHDAVMIGVGTAMADNPQLTCRLAGMEQAAKVRVVVDSHLRTPLTSLLLATAAKVPTWFLARDDVDPVRRHAAEGAGAVVLGLAGSEAGIDLVAGLEALAKRGITRVLAEGGAGLAAGLLRAGLVDRLAWFHAPAVMGGDGWPATAPIGTELLAAMPRFRRQRVVAMGEDMFSEYRFSEDRVREERRAA
ncbi:MAG: bifunctional diaminohydroxyphosphoribosylaminopyrimidine deaminase/5-amino-6-(5-phosphoribosylamino)uracil reductase RibD [Rhodospirillales bacterium]|nr:bifunctional diaminohydroxyphosphoribosylaminopyrimidine deaminase/5-amino-6-(5-phosphoribosylamino)uracil reductase RibD [Rhodospirillales bacterium]